MGSLDRKQKRCCTSCSLQRPCCVDRLTSLPDELVTRILSMLPTKDAAAAQVLSKRMRRAFCWITNVDLVYSAKLTDLLPMFRNLRTLKLGSLCDSLRSARWDVVLLLILHRAPLLEELVFREGFCYWKDGDTCGFHDPDFSDDAAAWEAASWGITQTIPSCCEFHLKRIRIYNCHGCDQELNMIRFLLGSASVLKEFVISMSKGPDGILFDAPKFDQFKNILEKIPRASNSCAIIYSNDEPNYN